MNRIIPNLSYEEYGELPGYNSSLLKVAAGQSLFHALAYMDGRMKRESDALDFGTAFHELLLRDRRKYIVRPETYAAPKDHPKVKALEILAGAPLPWYGNSGICKQWLTDNNPDGLPVMDHDEGAALEAMIAAVRANEELAPYLAGQSEVAILAERRGIKYKALVDLLPNDPKGPIIDFKKCRSAKPESFVRDALNFGYHVQAALNMDVLAWNGDVRSEFWNVAVEDKPPHAVWICKFRDASPSLIRLGRARYSSAVSLLETAKKTGNWPAYQSAEPEAFAPAWMIGELEKT